MISSSKQQLHGGAPSERHPRQLSGWAEGGRAMVVNLTEYGNQSGVPLVLKLLIHAFESVPCRGIISKVV